MYTNAADTIAAMSFSLLNTAIEWAEDFWRNDYYTEERYYDPDFDRLSYEFEGHYPAYNFDCPYLIEAMMEMQWVANEKVKDIEIPF